MPRAKLITPGTKASVQKKRVAAYCRVSTNSADQLNSYATQIKVYTALIESKSEWQLVDIFADEGISGMTAEKRPEFLRMIHLCEQHEIDLIITKSVSRFARNVKEALEYVRKLRLLGVGVQFEKEGISTLALGDEMLLNTFSAIAQEESKSISQNVRMGIVRRMESGEYLNGNAPYGFRIADKSLAIYEPEAQVVREIFRRYLSGWSLSELARDLTSRGVPTKNDSCRWRPSNISYILSNERYVGDCCYQKSFNEDDIPFKQIRNRGQKDMYYATETHEPVVDKDTFDRAKELLEARKTQFGKNSELNTFPLTSRIRCAECGSYFQRKIRGGTPKWVCCRHFEESGACDSFYYSEERIYAGFMTMVNKLRFGDTDILGQTTALLGQMVQAQKRRNSEAGQISQTIAELNAKVLMLDQLRAKGYLAIDVYQSQSRELQNQILRLKGKRQDAMDSKLSSILLDVTELKHHLEKLDTPMEEFDEDLFRKIVTDITLNNRDEMTITVLGGLKFTEII